MTTLIQAMGLFSMIALGTATPACSSSRVDAAPVPEQAGVAQTAADTRAAAVPSAKTSAPVRVALTASGKLGTVVLTLSVQPQADVARGVARIVLPAGVKLVSGQTEVELGPLKRGVALQHQVTVEVPSGGSFQIFAGVDCHLSAGVRLHKAAEAVTLGQLAPTETSL